MEYTIEDLKKMSNNSLNQIYYARTLIALNGLVKKFGKEWVEKEIVAYYITDKVIVEAIGKDKEYQFQDIEKLIFFYEDLQLLTGLLGYDEFLGKLRKGGITEKNVDLEISIIADIIRSGGTNINLEPPVGNGKADGCFQVNNSEDLIYLEVSRMIDPRINDDIDQKGKKLAQSLSLINPSKRCILVTKKELDNQIYNLLLNWIKTKPNEGDFQDIATFFTVDHNTDESPLVWQYYNDRNIGFHIRQGSNNIFDGSFGVVYLFKSHQGAMEKITKKANQLPKTNKNILIIDTTRILSAFQDWGNQISFTDEINHISCIILMRYNPSSNGWNREMKIIVNQNSVNLLTKEQLSFLERFSTVRKNMNLIN